MTIVYGLFRQHTCAGGRGGSADVLAVLYKTKEEARKHNRKRRTFRYDLRPLRVWDSLAEYRAEQNRRQIEDEIKDARAKLADAERDQREAAETLRHWAVLGQKLQTSPRSVQRKRRRRA